MWAKQCFNGINVGINHPSNHHFFLGGMFTGNFTRAQNPTCCASKSSSKSGSCRKMAVMPQSSHWKMENRIVAYDIYIFMITVDFLQWVYHGYLMFSMCVIGIYHVLYRWDQQLGPIYVHSPDARIQIVGSVFFIKKTRHHKPYKRTMIQIGYQITSKSVHFLFFEK